MRALLAFLRLSRPMFLGGGFAGYGLGAAVAAAHGTPVEALPYAAGQAMVTAFQLMTHYANDYFDRDADRAAIPTPFSGGSRVLVEGALPPRAALTAALVCAAAGTALASGAMAAGRPAAGSIGVVMGALAWCYSAPPLRLLARGWGEVDTALVVAILVPAAGATAVGGAVDLALLTAVAGPALAMLAMMLAVEWPDRDADAAAGKRNLLVRLGRGTAAALARAAAAGAAAATLLLVPLAGPRSAALLGLLLLPPVWGFSRRINRPGTPDAEVAGRGVTLYALTVVVALLSYLSILH